MQQTTLADLDDLVLTVRDRNSRAYATEAISAYRAQAYRSAIISTWVAVVYDIISKCRELAGQGESESKKLTDELDDAIKRFANGETAAVFALQKIENGLLDKARDTFEFVSHQEHANLERLKQDRNLCAHPAFVQQDVLFQPTPEQVRAHIVHAVLHLLQHPPVQGKSALARLVRDLTQPSFPTEPSAVQSFLATKYLKHIKPALLKNVVTIFLKAVVRQSEPELVGLEAKVLSSLAAVRQHASAMYETTMADQLPKLTDNLADAELDRLTRLFPTEPRAWNWLSNGMRIRLQTMVAGYRWYSGGTGNPLEVGGMDYLFDVFAIPDLRSQLLGVIARLDAHEREQVVERHPCPEFKDAAIDLYAKSGSYRTAESRARKLILQLCDHFVAADIGLLTTAIGENDEIYDANDSPELVAELFRRTQRLHAVTKGHWEQLIRQLRHRDNTYFGKLETAMRAAGMTLPPPTRISLIPETDPNTKPD